MDIVTIVFIVALVLLCAWDLTRCGGTDDYKAITVYDFIRFMRNHRQANAQGLYGCYRLYMTERSTRTSASTTTAYHEDGDVRINTEIFRQADYIELMWRGEIVAYYVDNSTYYKKMTAVHDVESYTMFRDRHFQKSLQGIMLVADISKSMEKFA
jgi:hypothetical protein